MNVIKTILLASVATLLFTACGETTVDSRSMERYTSSIQNMKKDMSLKEKEQFESYIKAVVLQGTNFKNLLNTEAFNRRAMDRLNGLTVEEIRTKGKIIVDEVTLQKEKEAAEETFNTYNNWADEIMENKETIAK